MSDNSPNTFTICGIDGFYVEHRDRRAPGGQHVGISPITIIVRNDDLGIRVAVESLAQMEARDLAIIAAASVIEYQKFFSASALRQEVKRLTDKEYQFEVDNDEEEYYEF